MTTCGCKAPLRMHVRDRSYFFADEKIGRNMVKTPEGFLICYAVPIARIGEQLYGPEETGLDPGKDGFVHIQRDEDEVFRPETMTSFEGKDIVDEHPEEGVSPENWRELTVGHAQNVRRGESAEAGYLLADFVIKDPDAIDAVLAGKREVSCGYDCDYEQTGDGRGRQKNIVGNHIALVEKGRCGPRCSIKDHQTQELSTMAKNGKATVRDRLKAFFKVKDDAEFEKMLNSPDGEVDDAEPESAGGAVEIHNHIHMPGDNPAGETISDEAEGAAPGGAAPTVEDEPEDLPGWFLEHVAQNNARFDRLESLLAEIANKESDGDGDEGQIAEEAIEDENPEIAEEIAAAGDEDIEGEKPAGTGDEDETEAAESESMDAESEEAEEERKPADRARDGKKKPGAKDGKHKPRTKVADSAALSDSFQETVALSELLVPGIAVPTFDAKEPAKKTFDAICGLRRRTLSKAYAHDAELHTMIDAINGRPLNLKGMSCGAVRVLFRAVAGAKKATTDKVVSVAVPGAGGGMGIEDARKIRTPADLNKLNAERYGGSIH